MEYKFKHDSNEMHDAFCLTEDVTQNIICRIIFESTKANLLEKDFKDAGEEVPSELMKKTSVLETIIKTVDNKQEEIFAIFSFLIWHEKANYVWQKRVQTYEKLGDNRIMDKLKEGALDSFPGLDLSILEDKIKGFVKEKMAEFKRFDRLTKQIVNSNYDFVLFKAIIDGECDYVIDVVNDTMADV